MNRGPVVLFPDHVFQFFTGKATLFQNREQCSFCEFIVEGNDRSINILPETYMAAFLPNHKETVLLEK
jgi:hypothetical protein